MFIDDVNAKLKAQSDAIDALALRIPASADIVPAADQQAALAGIDANTAKIAALDVAK